MQVYRQTNFDALNGLVHLEFGLREVSPGIWHGSAVTVDPSAEIVGPAAIGNNVTIGAGAKLLGNVILGDGSVIEPNVTLKDTILWANAKVSAGTHLERCVVGTNAQVQSNVAIFDANIVDPTRLMTART